MFEKEYIDVSGMQFILNYGDCNNSTPDLPSESTLDYAKLFQAYIQDHFSRHLLNSNPEYSLNRHIESCGRHEGPQGGNDA